MKNLIRKNKILLWQNKKLNKKYSILKSNISELKKFEKLDEHKLLKPYLLMSYLIDFPYDDSYKKLLQTDIYIGEN